jgi:membrane-bound lytic murein transglycosylase D
MVLCFGLLLCLVLTACASKLAARTEGPEEDRHARGAAAARAADSPDRWNSAALGAALHHGNPLTGLTSLDASGGPEAADAYHHPSIQRYIRHYRGEGRNTLVTALTRVSPTLPAMADILKQYGVPPELVYVAFVESRFKTHARSPKGALGYWQLMPSTARLMGLRVDRRVDERLDPIKSTHAAARYLRTLYRDLRSWPLALAAYNTGGDSVCRAIQGRRLNSFWDLTRCDVLPGQTAAFVYQVFAAIAVASELKTHGLEPDLFAGESFFDLVWVQTDVNLHQVADWVGASVRELRSLNPGIQSDQVRVLDEAVCLRLPFRTKEQFSIAYRRHLAKDG